MASSFATIVQQIDSADTVTGGYKAIALHQRCFFTSEWCQEITFYQNTKCTFSIVNKDSKGNVTLRPLTT